MTCSESALQVVELGPDQVCLPQRKLPAIWGEVSWLWLAELRQATRGPRAAGSLSAEGAPTFWVVMGQETQDLAGPWVRGLSSWSSVSSPVRWG